VGPWTLSEVDELGGGLFIPVLVATIPDRSARSPPESADTPAGNPMLTSRSVNTWARPWQIISQMLKIWNLAGGTGLVKVEAEFKVERGGTGTVMRCVWYGATGV